MKLDEAYQKQMQELLGDRYPAYLDCLQQKPTRGVRVNTLKLDAESLRILLGDVSLRKNPLCEQGFIVEAGGESLGTSPLFAAGLYYLQDPSATLPVSLLAPYLPSDAIVLDMCAAPGGKSTQMAAMMAGRGFLVANETVFSRAKILMGNVERLGIRNAAVTCTRPDALADALGSIFDCVIADVPCSGEGMLRKEPCVATDWSERNVQSCALRGTEILRSAVRCLKAGGVAVFSTCTFNRLENEAVVERICREEQCEVVLPPDRFSAFAGADGGVRVYPMDEMGEGHFACLLRKKKEARLYAGKGGRPVDMTHDKKTTAALCSLLQSFSSATLCGDVYRQGDGWYLLPDRMPDLSGVGVVRAGVRIAERTGDRLVPHRHYVMTLAKGEFSGENFSADDSLLAAYVRGEQIPASGCDWQVVSVHGYPLGLIKVSNGVGKNHYPKGLRR